VGDAPLCVQYGRLFGLAVNKSISVADMCALGWEEGGEAWKVVGLRGGVVRGV